jgi:hypothetical protein
MASGILGRSLPAATTNTTVYTVPATKLASVTISATNQNSTDYTKIRIALSDTDTPNSSDYIEYDAPIPPGGVLERSAIVLAAGQKIVVRTTLATTSFVVFGIEE